MNEFLMLALVIVYIAISYGSTPARSSKPNNPEELSSYSRREPVDS